MTTRTRNTKQGASQGDKAFVFGYRQRRSEDYHFYDKENYDYENLISLSDIDDALEAGNCETTSGQMPLKYVFKKKLNTIHIMSM